MCKYLSSYCAVCIEMVVRRKIKGKGNENEEARCLCGLHGRLHMGDG